MILTCEKCHTRYQLKPKALEPDGRRVRCTTCKHEWFQTPEIPEEEPEEDLSFAAHMEEPREDIEIEPIPESVIPDHDPADRVPAPAAEEKEPDKGKIAGYGGAFAVFLLLALLIYLMPGPLSRFWPATLTLYETAGVKTTIPGENLIFEGLKAEVNKDDAGVSVLTVKGNILNLSHDESSVPVIQVSLLKADGSAVDSWLATPAQTELAPDAELAFSTSYPEIPEEVQQVNVRFVPGSKVEQEKAETESHEEAGSQAPAHEDKHEESHEEQEPAPAGHDEEPASHHEAVH